MERERERVGEGQVKQSMKNVPYSNERTIKLSSMFEQETIVQDQLKERKKERRKPLKVSKSKSYSN